MAYGWCFGTCVDVISAHKDEMLMNFGPNSYFFKHFVLYYSLVIIIIALCIQIIFPQSCL